jgi:hypothetical protein
MMTVILLSIAFLLNGCGEWPTRKGLRDMHYIDCRNAQIMDTYLSSLLDTSNARDTKLIKDMLWKYRDDCNNQPDPEPTYTAPSGKKVYYLNQDGSVMH